MVVNRPIIRQRLIANHSNPVIFEEFFIPFCARLSLNWPYPNDQVLVSNPDAVDPEESVRMNPVFESHLRELGNWSMGKLFVETFPFLIDESVRIERG